MKKIRTASVNDAEFMLEIYRPYVLETPISFETELPSLDEFSKRISETLQKYPWLVCEVDNKVVGYAYAGAYRSRPAYSWSAESTVYVQKGFHGKGIGKDLYANLLKILEAQGIVNVMGGITLPNEASVKLHEHFGFVQVAQFKDAGFKMDRWWDVGYWQLQFQKPEEPNRLQLPQVLR
jgi:L-amino acid N-acyltransferase YncA